MKQELKTLDEILKNNSHLEDSFIKESKTNIKEYTDSICRLQCSLSSSKRILMYNEDSLQHQFIPNVGPHKH